MVIGGRTTPPTGTARDRCYRSHVLPLRAAFHSGFILGVPILDMVFAIRATNSARDLPFAERDLGHLHHRLVRLGHGHRRAVLILWAWTAVMSVFVLLLSFGLRFNAFVPVPSSGCSWWRCSTPVFLPGIACPEPARRRLPVWDRTTAEVPSEVPGVSPISVVMSAAAGVAVAGEPDLASPTTAPAPASCAGRAGGGCRRPRPATIPGIVTPPAHIAGPGDEMRG